jgi:hypothetical protein
LRDSNYYWAQYFTRPNWKVSNKCPGTKI